MPHTFQILDLKLELSRNDSFADPLGQTTDSLPVSLPIKVSDNLGTWQSGPTSKGFKGQGKITEAQCFREIKQYASYSLGGYALLYAEETSIQRREWCGIL